MSESQTPNTGLRHPSSKEKMCRKVKLLTQEMCRKVTFLTLVYAILPPRRKCAGKSNSLRHPSSKGERCQKARYGMWLGVFLPPFDPFPPITPLPSPPSPNPHLPLPRPHPPSPPQPQTEAAKDEKSTVRVIRRRLQVTKPSAEDPSPVLWPTVAPLLAGSSLAGDGDSFLGPPRPSSTPSAAGTLGTWLGERPRSRG